MNRQDIIDLCSVLGTVIGFITFCQAISIKKQLNKQKMVSGFKNQVSEIKASLNDVIKQLSDNKTDYKLVANSYEIVSKIHQFAVNCKWSKKDIQTINDAMYTIQSYTKLYTHYHDLVKLHSINAKLITIKSIIEKEETLI